MNKLFGNMLALATFLGLSLAASDHAAAQEGALPPIRIRDFSTEGAGCPFGTVVQDDANTSATQQSVSLGFSAYRIAISGAQTSMSINCTIRVYMEVPAGLKTAVTAVTFYGTANLGSSVQGQLTTLYNWAGRPVQTRSNVPKSIKPGTVGRFTFVDEASAKAWSPCKKEEVLEIRSYLNLANYGTTTGSLSVDNVEPNIASTVENRWPTISETFSGVRIDLDRTTCEQ